MDVVILDAHPEYDARIIKHVKYLLDEEVNVYRIHYNFLDESIQPGAFSQLGEMAFRINLLFYQGKFRTLYYLIYCLRKKILKDSLNALKVLNFDPVQPSIIHVHDPQLLTLAVMLVKNGLSNSKIVYDRHEIYEKKNKTFGVHIPIFYEKQNKNFILGLVVVSEQHVSMAQPLFPNSNVVTVQNYPLSKMYIKSIINNKILSFKPDSKINVVYIGSLNNLFDRDVDLLIKIADNMLQSYDNVNFIVGGNYLDKQSKMKIDNLSKKYKTRFQYLGYVPRNRTIELTQSAHIGLLLVRPDTSYWVKTSPNKVFEYLICGTVPIVRADVDHADEIRKCSFIFKRSDEEEVIVKAALDLVGNHKKLKELMMLSRDLSVNYTWESVACQYIELYDTLLHSDIAHKN